MEDEDEEEVEKLEERVIRNKGKGKIEDERSDEVMDKMGSKDIGFKGGLIKRLLGGMEKERKKWWKGNNVCVESEEIDERKNRKRKGENYGKDKDEEGGSILGYLKF